MLIKKLKTFACIMLAAICLLGSVSFATDATDTNVDTTSADISAISDTTNDTATATDDSQSATANQTTGDIYAKQFSYTFSDNVIGNVHVAANDFTIDPKGDSSSGIVQGNLFVAANTVTMKSDATYSTTSKDAQGNADIDTVSSAAIVTRNTFIVANKVVVQPGCILNGDVYIVANEVDIQSYATVYGNLYVTANKLTFNGGVYLSLYANVNDFEMTSMQAIINTDAHINANQIVLAGTVNGNSYLQSNKLVTDQYFVNYGTFNATSKTAVLLGDFKGDATVKAKNLSVITKDNINDNKNLLKGTPALKYLVNANPAPTFTTTFEGNLTYTAKSEINFADGVVAKDSNGNAMVQFTKYSGVKTFMYALLFCVLGLLTLLVYVSVIYFLTRKFRCDCSDCNCLCSRFDNKLFTVKRALISLGIGVAAAIVVPIVCILLALVIVGVPLAGLLAAIYGIMLALSVPAVLIGAASFLNEKFLKGKLNHYLAVLCMTAIFWLLTLIPYAGVVIAALVLIVGSGNLVVSLCKKNKKCCEKKD